jgi:thymidylate synthase (FAD)
LKIVQPSYEIQTYISPYGILELERIERAARVCYKSEDRYLDQGESAKKLIRNLIKNGHEAMLEHSSLTVKFICDRGISHELVRHRMASFAQESTRYCNYSQDKFDSQITVIEPFYLEKSSEAYRLWEREMAHAEETYFDLLNQGLTPQEARCVLPNSLKTEVVITANYREWRHMLKLRTDKAAHPQMRELMVPLLKDLYEQIPVIFDDIYENRRD